MSNICKKIIILGNGFDLSHNMKTKYQDFIRSCDEFKEKYAQFEGENWKDVEKNVADAIKKVSMSLIRVEPLEELEDILNNYGFNKYGFVDYYGYRSNHYDDAMGKAEDLILLFNEFSNDFHEYLRKNYSDDKLNSINKKRVYEELFSEHDYYITFNYTNVLEKIYEVKNVIHIHGNINDEILLGYEDICSLLETIDSEYPNSNHFLKISMVCK